MVGNMIRVLRARLTLLAVDEAGMSTVVHGSPAARSMTRCANCIDRFTRLQFGQVRSIEQPDRHRRIADQLQQFGMFGGEPRRLAILVVKGLRHQHAGHGDGQRYVVAGCCSQLAELVEACVGDAAADSPGAPAQQSAGRHSRGALRCGCRGPVRCQPPRGCRCCSTAGRTRPRDRGGGRLRRCTTCP
jgi:hypothetical protein